jgi:urease accessory protein
MVNTQSAPLRSWRAQLALEFERRAARTVLSARRHDGPLVIQKPLYPEGDEVCHAIIVHPPGGIAGGDELELSADLGTASSALLTTPGATKWYRSAGAWARQQVNFNVNPGASLEWLPQETIVFDGARADARLDVAIKGNGAFIGWEILCLGRTGSAERFTRGEWRARMTIERDGKPLWFERARLAGNEGALESPAVLAGQPVAATMLAAADQLNPSVLEACRGIKPLRGEGAVTLLSGLLVGRYLGVSSEAAKFYFIKLWQILRPALIGRTAVEPRIWRT